MNQARARLRGVLVPVAVLLGFVFALGEAQAKPAYFIQADLLRGAVGAMGAVCVPNSIFQPGEQIVWRAYVYDADSGELLSQEQIDAKGIKVFGQLDNGVKAELRYIPHPPDSPKTELYWAGGFQIPADFPTGAYGWSVVVEDPTGVQATYLPMGHSVGLANINVVAPPAGDAGTAPATSAAVDGEKVFVANCSACHQLTGSGIAGAFPPLAKNPLVTAADPTFVTRVVLFGLSGKISVAGTDYNGLMPSWEKVLDDAEIAAVLTYVRSHWGNSAPAVDAAAVAAQRAKPGTADENHANYPH